MIRLILVMFSLVCVFSACKEDAQKTATAPAPVTTPQSSNADLATVEALKQKIVGLETRNQVLEAQVAALSKNTGVNNANSNVTPPGTAVIPVPTTNNSTINTLIQVALGFFNKPKATGTCGPGGSNCCTPGAYSEQCIAGTTSGIYCNAAGSEFESKVVSGRCGAP